MLCCREGKRKTYESLKKSNNIQPHTYTYPHSKRRGAKAGTLIHHQRVGRGGGSCSSSPCSYFRTTLRARTLTRQKSSRPQGVHKSRIDTYLNGQLLSPPTGVPCVCFFTSSLRLTILSFATFSNPPPPLFLCSLTFSVARFIVPSASDFQQRKTPTCTSSGPGYH